MQNNAPSVQPEQQSDPPLETARAKYLGKRLVIDYGSDRRAGCIVGSIWRSPDGIRCQLIFAPNIPRAVDLSFLENNASILPTIREVRR